MSTSILLETILSQSVWFPNIVVELEFWLGSGFEPTQIFHFLRIIEKFEYCSFCSNLLETLRIVRIRIYSKLSLLSNGKIRILSRSDSILLKSFAFFEEIRRIRILSRSDSKLLESFILFKTLLKTLRICLEFEFKSIQIFHFL